MLNSVNATEALGWSGFDWLLVDGEHTPVSLHDAIAHSRAIAASPTVPIFRVVWNDRILLKQHLDAGLSTLMIPYVQNVEEARAAVDFVRYPPQGSRGIVKIHRAAATVGDFRTSCRASQPGSVSDRGTDRNHGGAGALRRDRRG